MSVNVSFNLIGLFHKLLVADWLPHTAVSSVRRVWSAIHNNVYYSTPLIGSTVESSHYTRLQLLSDWPWQLPLITSAYRRALLDLQALCPSHAFVSLVFPRLRTSARPRPPRRIPHTSPLRTDSMSEYSAVPPPGPGAALGAVVLKKDAFADAVQRARQVSDPQCGSERAAFVGQQRAQGRAHTSRRARQLSVSMSCDRV